MRVKMLISVAGGVSLSPGDIHECDEAEAKRMINAGYALPEQPAKPSETTQKKRPAKETR